jgi:hypothetical protein
MTGREINIVNEINLIQIFLAEMRQESDYRRQ